MRKIKKKKAEFSFWEIIGFAFAFIIIFISFAFLTITNHSVIQKNSDLQMIKFLYRIFLECFVFAKLSDYISLFLLILAILYTLIKKNSKRAFLLVISSWFFCMFSITSRLYSIPNEIAFCLAMDPYTIFATTIEHMLRDALIYKSLPVILLSIPALFFIMRNIEAKFLRKNRFMIISIAIAVLDIFFCILFYMKMFYY